MNRHPLILLFLLSAVVLGCSKGNSSSSLNPGSPSGQTKKGACFSTNQSNGTWYGDVAALTPFWFYTWGTPLPANPPSNCEFVPMFWGGANVTTENIALVQQLKAQGLAKYVLGFNEPDQAGQSDMTVSQALALWPQLESIGLPLGSPAPSWPTIPWFTDFMDSVQAEGLRVDFICVHMYVGLDDSSFVQVLQTLYDTYHLPIWITEFATADWNATTPASNPYTPGQVLAFMQRLLPRLDSLGFVRRYSWFSGDPTSAALWPSALVDATGALTNLGAWYAQYEPNSAVKP